MRTHSPLVLNVVELLENPGRRQPIDFEAPVLALEIGPLVSVTEPVRFDLTLEALDGGILVQGALSGAYHGSCRRCLAELTGTFSFDAADTYRPPSDVWEEGYVITDGTIDLERLMRDTVALSLPASPLCRPDCAGLCHQCGADLNVGICDCEPPADPRWTALRELKGKLNG